MFKKNIVLGNNFKYLAILISFLFYNPSFSENEIVSSPLINLEELKPSFEDTENDSDNFTNNKQIKNKTKINISESKFNATLIGLDKITAKSSQILVKFNEPKKFGPLEIKILKCGKVENNNILDDVAYMQVKDLSKNENEKVFIFNGWTFASDPNLTPFDHAIYDLQLVNCKV
tara:strand:- start:2257 stop:2778 length:522 start_codon:yes stop_codon:yes gene_type:complete